MDKSQRFGEREERESVNPIFLERWSPRAFNKNFELSDKELGAIFGAARWAPSCYNEQPWRFKVALNNSDKFSEFLELLVEQNQVWAKNTAALSFIIGEKKFSRNNEYNSTYAFDCGSAWMSIALQASMLDLHAHGMAGIKKKEIERYFELDLDKSEVICAFAIGKRASPEDLPKELQEKEKLNDRKSISEIVKFY